MKRTTTNNFSLIELLITISIIAILAALLMPGLNAARRKARTISCLSTQRQYAYAVNMYTDSSDGYYFFGKEPPVTDAASACQMMSGWLDVMLMMKLLPCRDYEKNNRRLPSATCPEYVSIASGVYYGSTPYVINSFMGSWPDGLVTTQSDGSYVGCRSVQVKKPSALAIFGDRGLTQSPAASMPVIWQGEQLALQFDDQSGVYGRRLRANAHGNGCNLAYADGHAGFIRYSAIRAGLFMRDPSRSSWHAGYPVGGY